MNAIFDEEDDFLAQLGVEIPWPPAKGKKGVVVECGQKAPKAPPKRHTEWSNEGSFEFGGYLAMVVQTTCEECGSMRERLEGVFSCEIKRATGARRLQALSDRGQWPTTGGRCEVRQEFVRWCPDCVRVLGFDQEIEAVPARAERQIVIQG